MADGSLDAGLVRCAPARDGEAAVLRREPQGVLLHARHPLAARDATVALGELRDERC